MILKLIPQAEILHRFSTNTRKCIILSIHKGLILEAAIENVRSKENPLKTIWSVAKELRKDSLSFINSCELDVKRERLREPALLVSFLKWFYWY